MPGFSDPVLILSGDELDELRRRSVSSHARYYDAMVADLASRFDDLPPEGLWSLEEPDYSDNLEICFSLVVNAGIAYHVSQDDRWLSLASRWLEQWVSEGTADESKVKGSYLVGFHVMALAYGLDLFGKQLPEAFLERIVDVLRVETERMVRNMAKGEAGWSRRYHYHDCWVPVFGSGIGCLALLPYVDEAESWLGVVSKEVGEILSLQSEDGAWNEGVAPLNYALGPMLFYLEGRRRALGENAFDVPWLRGLSSWRANHLLPSGEYVFLDDSTSSGRYHGETGGVVAFQLYKIAGELGDGLAQWQALLESDRSFLKDYHGHGWSFLWYDPAVSPVPPREDLPTASFHPSWGQFFSRTGFSVGASVLSFECVQPGGLLAQNRIADGLPIETITQNKHAHYKDRATFTYFCEGEYFFRPSGYFRFETEFKNTLTFDGKGQSLSIDSGGRMLGVHLGEGDDYAAARCEAGQAYDEVDGLSGFDRTVLHSKSDNALFVLDHVGYSGEGNHRVDAHFHVGNEMSIVTGKDGSLIITSPNDRSCSLIQVCGEPTQVEEIPQPVEPFWYEYLSCYDIPPQDLEAMNQVDVRFRFDLSGSATLRTLWAILPGTSYEVSQHTDATGLYFWYQSPRGGLRLAIVPTLSTSEAAFGPVLPTRPETIFILGCEPHGTIQLALEPREHDRWAPVLNAGEQHTLSNAGTAML